MNLQPTIIAIAPHTAPRSPQQVDQQRRYARLALQHCATCSGAPSTGWEKDGNNVPLPNDGYYWSISHKRQWAAAVIADRPVGIDIEYVAPRRHRLHKALAHSSEWALLGDESWHSFYRLWTAKEAVLKANGVGIAALMRCCLVDLPDDHHMILTYRSHTWCVECFCHDHHIAALTCGSAPVKWIVLSQQGNLHVTRIGSEQP